MQELVSWGAGEWEKMADAHKIVGECVVHRCDPTITAKFYIQFLKSLAPYTKSNGPLKPWRLSWSSSCLSLQLHLNSNKSLLLCRDIILSDNSHHSALRPLWMMAGSTLLATIPFWQVSHSPYIFSSACCINVRFLTTIFNELTICATWSVVRSNQVRWQEVSGNSHQKCP
jgi:hypothetical protein